MTHSASVYNSEGNGHIRCDDHSRKAVNWSPRAPSLLSRILTVQKKILSIILFRKENGILRNSNEPNGEVMTVFWMSSGASGIRWYASTRPTLKETQPWICGIGRQSPGFDFLPMLRGDGHLLSDGRTMPNSIICSNTDWAVCLFVGSSWWYRS